MKYIYCELRHGNETILIKHYNIRQVDFTAYDRGTLDGIVDWGIYANTGSISFLDYNNTFFELIELLNSGELEIDSIDCHIFLKTTNSSKQLAVFYVEDFTYNEETKEVKLTLADKLLRWQNINTDRDFIFETTPLWDIFKSYMDKYTTSGYSYTDLAYSVLEGINIYCPDIEADTLWGVMTKICEASGCRIYTNGDGVPEISHSMPSQQYNYTVIKPYHILKIDNKISKFKTKIPSVSLSVTYRGKKYNADVADAISVNLYEIPPLTLNTTQSQGIYVGDKSITQGITGTKQFLFEEARQIYDVNIGFESPILSDCVVHSLEGYRASGSSSYFIHSTDISTLPIIQSFPNITVREFSQELNETTVSGTIHVEGAMGATYSTDGFAIAKLNLHLIGNFYKDYDDIILVGGATNSSNDVKLSTNKLIQRSNTWIAPDENTTNWGEELINRVITKYKDGVECCEIECTTTDYYDKNGKLILSPSKSSEDVGISFSKYDVVVPYVIRHGKEVPYRTNKYGTPMEFRITGIKYSYKGILRQTLCLMEATL